MTKFSKLGVISVAGMLIVAGTAGCSNVATYQVQLPDATVTIADITSQYTAEAPLEINFWTGFGSAVAVSLDAAIADFQIAYPYIKVTHTSKGGYDNLLKAINLSITSRTYPNLAVGYPDHFANYIRSSIQYALDPMISSAEYGVDINDYISDYMVENQSFQYADEAKTQPYTLGLPFNKSTEVMVANKTFFEWIDGKAQPYASVSVPETWDEVRSTGETIISLMTQLGAFGKKIDATGAINANAGKAGQPALLLDFTTVTAENFRPFTYDSQSNFFITAVRQWGGVYTQMGENITKGFVRFNTPGIVEMLTFFKELEADKILGIPTTFGETGYNSVPFKAIKSVMTVGSSAGIYNNVPTGGAFDISVHPIPFKDVEHKYVISQGTNMAIFTNRDKLKVLASWLFLRFMTTTANTQFAISSAYYPATVSGIASEMYQAYINTTVDSDSNLSKIGAAKINADIYGNNALNWNKFVDPGFVGSSDIREQVDTIFPILFYGKDGTPLTEQELLDYIYVQLSKYVEVVA